MILDIRYDFQRSDRIGILEAIWGEDKNIDQLRRVTKSVLSKNKIVFITRIDKKKAKILSSLYPNAEFYEEANCLTIGTNSNLVKSDKKIAIISGGSSDLRVTLEAKIALDIYGVNCETFIDVGVAGLHRLLNKLDEINKCDILIVCAGMEGALATVIGGLLPQPMS